MALAWCLDDETSAYADSVLAALAATDAVVPAHWGLEVANGLLVAERRGRIAADDAPRLASFLLALPIAVDPVARGLAFTATYRLARTHRLSSYDASYLELAVRHGVRLATLDGALGEAAAREGVGVWRAGPAS